MATKTYEAKSTRYLVKRDGRKIPAAEVDSEKLDEQLSIDEAVSQTVVAVSPPPGSTVPRGTKVTITLAASWELRPPILKYYHLALGNETFESIYNRFLTNDEVVRIVTENKTAAGIPARDLTILQGALAGKLTITTEPGHDLNAALKTLQGAVTFAGTRVK